MASDFSVTSPSAYNSTRPAIWALLLRVGGAVLVLAALFHFLPVRKVGAALHLLPVYLWVLILAGYLTSHFVASLKWRLMVNLAGSGLSVPQAVRCYFAGLFSVLFLPSIVGGDVVRAALALRMGRSKAAVLLGSFLDRILDFLALAFLTIIGATLVPGSLTPSSRRVFVFAGCGAAILVAVVVLTLILLPARRFSFRLRRKLVRLREAQEAMSAQSHYVLAAYIVAVIVQSAFIVLTSVIANVAGLHLPLQVWVFAWPMAKISALVPLTQGGIGVREAALAGLLLPFGAPAAMTVAVGLAWEGITIAGALIGGLASYAVGRFKLDAA
jgi:uncharacterized membrane protein YbhN (UPF0104 family)